MSESRGRCAVCGLTEWHRCEKCNCEFWPTQCQECSTAIAVGAARDETERACAAEALAVYQRDILAEACRSFLAQLDYLQDLWSKEGVTNTVAEKARHALKSLDESEAPR